MCIWQSNPRCHSAAKKIRIVLKGLRQRDNLGVLRTASGKIGMSGFGPYRPCIARHQLSAVGVKPAAPVQ